MRKIIVNADDFGLLACCNKGILKGWQEGIVSSASLLVTGTAWQIGLAEAKAAGMPLGLHLCLTFGQPIARRELVSSLLAEDGRFKRPQEQAAVLPDPAVVELEWRAQIRLLQAQGFAPDHLDSHHYMHEKLGKDVLAVAVGLAKELGVPLRQTSEETKEVCRLAGVKTPDLFVRDFYGEGASFATLEEIVSRPWQGVLELMCHPAEYDEQLAKESSYSVFRQTELAVLLAPKSRRLLVDNGIALADFSAI